MTEEKLRLFSVNFAFVLTVALLNGGHQAFGQAQAKGKSNQTQSQPHEVSSQLQPIMHEFYRDLLELRPALKSVENFKSKENLKSLQAVMAKIKGQLHDLKAKPALEKMGGPALVELFRKHLSATEDYIELEDYERAYLGVRQATEFCFACHTRLPQMGSPSLDWKEDLKAQDPQNALTTADFYFVTRRYDISINIYDELIAIYPESVLKQTDLRDVFHRKLLIFSRVWRDPSQGILSLNRDLQNSKLPINLRKDIEVWKKSFTDWKREIAGKSEDLRSRQQKVTYAKKILAEMKSYRGPAGLEPFLVPLLRVSGVLYEDLAQAKTKMDQAETLYYLGKIERLLSQSSFLLLGDLYLKECIHKAPHSKWAPACLTEYKEYLKWRYPGGVALPASISKEIKGFEKEIASAKKPASK